MVSSLAFLLLTFPSVSQGQPEGWEPTDYYAAIAFSQSTGRWGQCSGHAKTREDAERCALGYCNARDARVVVWAKNAWCALALGNSRSAYGFAWGGDPEQTKARALAEARNRTAGAYIAVCVYAGGIGKGTILVDLPEDAKLFLDGAPVPGDGRLRVITTGDLLGGRDYKVELTAEIPGAGGATRKSMDVVVRAGKTSTVRFERPSVVVQQELPSISDVPPETPEIILPDELKRP